MEQVEDGLLHDGVSTQRSQPDPHRRHNSIFNNSNDLTTQAMATRFFQMFSIKSLVMVCENTQYLPAGTILSC